MGSEVEQELEDRWWLGLRGRHLRSVTSRPFLAELVFDGPAILSIESLAYLERGGMTSSAVVFAPDRMVVTTASVESLVDQRLVSAVAFKTGVLRLAFGDGTRLILPPAEDYEAWQVTGVSGRMWVSVAGGGLASFPPPVREVQS